MKYPHQFRQLDGAGKRAAVIMPRLSVSDALQPGAKMQELIPEMFNCA